jgi:hypothetical protein
MEARRGVAAKTAERLVLTGICLAAVAASAPAATVRTANFEIFAPTTELAQQLADAAEQYRQSLSLEWLGYELPQWEERCPIHARIARGAGGETSFYFNRGRVHGWRMLIQGSPERMLDSVLPHEVTHTVFATHFRGPLPRWADEGASTTVEHPGEVARMEHQLIRFLKTRRGIRFSDMMWMKQYPKDFMPLYAQGHSVAKYLIDLQGKRSFIHFLENGLRDDNWPRAAKEQYGFDHLADMQNQWLDWVKVGRPTREPAAASGTQLLANQRVDEPLTGQEVVVRGQEPAGNSLRNLPVARKQEMTGNASTPATPVSTASANDSKSIIFQWRAPAPSSRAH